MGSGAKSKRKRNVAVDYLVYLAVRLLLCVIQALPEHTCVSLAKVLAWVCGDLLRIRAQVVDDNLRHAFPDASPQRRQQICRGMWLHLMLLICEIARANRKIHETNWREHISFEGCRQLLGCQLTDRAVLIVTAHFGNFEISGFVAGLLGMPSITVARPLDNPFLRDFIVRFRESTGQQIVPSHGSAEIVGKAVEGGATLAILGDHYGGPKGVWVDFFNRPASCHKSIALLALSYNVPLLVFNTRRSGGLLNFEMIATGQLLDPLDAQCPKSVTELTQWYVTQTEKAIAQTPEQYWWLHRRWKDTRAALRRKRKEKRSQSTQRVDAEAAGGVRRSFQPSSPSVNA